MDEDHLVIEVRRDLNRRREQPNPFERYGLLMNPFPRAGEQTAHPSYNQREANKIFREKLVNFVRGGGERSDRFFVYGDHRVGKTNFLLHSKYVVDTLASAGDIEGFQSVYVPQPGDGHLSFHRDLIEALATNAIPSLLNEVRLEHDMVDIHALSSPLSSVLSHLSQLEDLEDMHIRLFSKWLSGERCSVSELNKLGGPSFNVTTSSLATKLLWQLFSLMRSTSILYGLIVFFDEFELIFGASLSVARRARYVQDLRHFIDVFQKGIFLVVASLPGVQPQLQREYPALRNRLGKPRELTEIRDEREAIEYANAYIQYGRGRYKQANPDADERRFDTLLGDKVIGEAFQRVKEEQGKVVQGPFYDELYRVTESKVAST